MSHNMYQYNVIYAFYNFIFTHIISTKNPNYIYIYLSYRSQLTSPECTGMPRGLLQWFWSTPWRWFAMCSVLNQGSV